MMKNRIRKEIRSGSLVLRSVRLEDLGNYTCRASNKHGFIEWTYIVSVVCEWPSSYTRTVKRSVQHLCNIVFHVFCDKIKRYNGWVYV